MKIVNKSLRKNIDQIEPGELFVRDRADLYDNSIFMKVDSLKSNYNAVRIDNGKLQTIDRNEILNIVYGSLNV